MNLVGARSINKYFGNLVRIISDFLENIFGIL